MSAETATYDVGSSLRYWRDAYFSRRVYCEQLGGSATLSLLQNVVPYYGTLALGSAAKPFLSVYGQSMYQTVCYANSVLSMDAALDIAIKTQNSSARSVFIQAYDTALRTVAQAINGRFDIPRAGDISLQDDRYLGVGKVTALPTPSSAYRGKMVYLDFNYSGSMDDELYICLWRDALGDYSWVKIA